MATQLEQSFRDICAKHDIHAVSIGILLPNDNRGSAFSVSLQRWIDGHPSGCWQAGGSTIQGALGEAIAQIYAVEEIALVDEPLTVEAV